MRLQHARWILAAAQQNGIGLSPEDDPDHDAAWFRVVGVDGCGPVNLQVESNVGLGGLEPWERPLLTSVAHELRESLSSANDNNAEGDEDGLW